MSTWSKSRWILAMVPLLIGAGSFLFAWFSHADKNPPHSQETDAPRLACDNPGVDVGEIGQPEVKHTYTLRNPCKRQMRITKIGKSCNCLKPRFDRRVIGPGETAQVEITIHVNAKNPARISRFRERLAIHCDDQDDRLELELSGTYVPPLYYEMTQINLIAPEKIGEPIDGKFEVFLRRDKDVKIRQVQVRTIACEAAVNSRTSVGTGDFDKVVIAIRGNLSETPLPQTGTLEIQTTSADVPVIQTPIVLFNPRVDQIKMEPPRLAVGIVPPGSQVVREVKFRLPAGASYEVERITSSSPRIVVTRKQEGIDGKKDEHALGFRCSIDCKGVTGKIDEKIVFHLKNGTRHQTYTIPVSGFVKPLAPAQ